ncbi:hypothetical protein OG923_33815 (plasmid) [Streptomyces halstedii]|uniref:hypothetical protein n=1 Tax=Streptomyces halstedii TaxID=1944 RepID=UPI003247D835
MAGMLGGNREPTEVEVRRGIGARRAADALRVALGLAGDGLDVLPADIERLAADGVLAEAGEYRGHRLFDAAACAAPGTGLAARVREVVEERVAWTGTSVPAREAAAQCGLTQAEFASAAEAAGLPAGPLGRWARSDVAALKGEAGAVRSRRTLGPRQAADRLGVRGREFEYLVEAGALVAVERVADRPAQFTVRDLDTVAGRADLGWAAARAADPRRPSPWRELAGPIAERDAHIHALVTELRRQGVDAWARHRAASDRWTLDWAPGGAPTADEVAASWRTGSAECCWRAG